MLDQPRAYRILFDVALDAFPLCGIADQMKESAIVTGKISTNVRADQVVGCGPGGPPHP